MEGLRRGLPAPLGESSDVRRAHDGAR
jgi:hypothetical protein